ncbi:prefoldin-like protein, putative [Plasmodium chabaudi chabaudi]|uniref:Prefoldin-like protein, putative n=1 Tax=Plasmodium chabaudi chabaudi TaxID=31271 RepID=A0A4V0K6N4_PLACU|nr:prefoldin-like protein, putative [Plasmodium chabaudi chabaudi]VTZ68298.1 prefoldin-like protein, putative [Plasmodium chabaudi chabaudi]|eukprot:XP_745359.1 conserved Plasmodium protein, unknown function [Plasmodium chabaudi chabaudi]
MANLENLKEEDVKGGTERILLKLKNEKINENILKRTMKEYEETLDILSVLTKKLNYKIMIPFSKMAFFEGEVKYTNNIYQDIGCNTYCERTSYQAYEFLKKKLAFYQDKYKIVSNSINKLTKELELSLELTHTMKLENEGNKNNSFIRPDGFLEIREEYNESDEGEQENSHHPNNAITNFAENKNDVINVADNKLNADKVKREDTEVGLKNCENKNAQNKTETDKHVNETKKVINSKSLNVNKQGLLNISERYESSGSSSRSSSRSSSNAR